MLLHRAAGLLDPDSISKQKILLAGLGSMGSLIAANLAYPFRQIVLVDPQDLAEENVERHLLGRRFLGRPKVEGVAEYLIDKGVPPSRIVTSTGRAERVCEEHPDTDLAIVNIDDPLIEADINGWCIRHDIPALYAGVYARCAGGEVMVIPTPKEVCYLCACHKMKRDIYKGAEVHYDSGVIVDRETMPIPALHWTISATAADLAGFALEMLSGRQPEPQVLVRANHSFEQVLKLGTDPVVHTLASFVRNQSELGLVPTMRIATAPSGRLAMLEAKRSMFSLVLARSRECTKHEPGRSWSIEAIKQRRY